MSIGYQKGANMIVEKVHLYVEKVSKQRKEILLDFVDENEFQYFKCHGDYNPAQNIIGKEYQPTMILVHNFSPEKTICKGSLITLDMKSLMELQQHQIKDENEIPSSVILEIHNGSSFSDLINNEEICGISRSVPDEYKRIVTGTWEDSPCALDHMSPSFELRIWDVGQGNTNSIYDGDNLALFDFGASMYYGTQKIDNIIQNHRKILNAAERVTLIISHWDLDHFNMLCRVADSFFSDICCVFCPPIAIGLTASQVIDRIQDNCNYINVINPAPKTCRWCGVCKSYEGDRYCLYVGEESRSKNNSGLLLLVKGKSSVAMLTADHSNYQVWRKVYPDIDKDAGKVHVVVPHHGGRCGNTKIQNDIKPGVAIISVGGNMYGHPKASVESEYRKSGYTVRRTDSCGKDIVKYL